MVRRPNVAPRHLARIRADRKPSADCSEHARNRDSTIPQVLRCSASISILGHARILGGRSTVSVCLSRRDQWAHALTIGCVVNSRELQPSVIDIESPVHEGPNSPGRRPETAIATGRNYAFGRKAFPCQSGMGACGSLTARLLETRG